MMLLLLPTTQRVQLLVSIATTAVSLIVASLVYVYRFRPYRATQPASDPTTYAFFHPYTSGGGGGERVLWKMIQFLQQQEHREGSKPSLEITIYTVDPPSTNEAALRHDAERRFDVTIPHPIRLVSLHEYRDCLRPRPYLSLVLESFGTMQLAWHALQHSPHPNVFCDTTGCAFTYAVVRWVSPRTRILAYVHYPTISTDMMLWEWTKQGPSTSLWQRIKTCIKLVYYWMFAILYGLAGSLADVVLVNSTWTYNHISTLWRFCRQDIEIVYPPCRVPNRIDHGIINGQKRERTIVSIAQFRPEKDHALQIEALAKLLTDHPELILSSLSAPPVKLLLIGSCRNDDDQGRVDALRQLVHDCNLEDHVTFSINPPYQELQESMTRASIGIHTMRQEHFGIGIVEMMAAGLIVVAHNSGGPQSDIVTPNVTGFLATTADEYAECLYQALTMDEAAAASMRVEAQKSVTRFSDQAFDDRMEHVLPLLKAQSTPINTSTSG